MAIPKVTFLLPVYNGERYLAIALASLRWQTHTDWEAVCVDNGSTDSTPEILRRFAQYDQRFRIVAHPSGGIVGALNRGLEEAHSEWVARMDADDIALPNRLAVQLRYLDENPDCTAVGGSILQVDPDAYPTRVNHYPTTHEEIETNLLTMRGGTVSHPAMVLHRDRVLAAGAYRQQYAMVEDLDLWLRITRTGKIANVPDVVLLYRRNPGSVTANHSATQHAKTKQILEEAYRDRGLPFPAELLTRLSVPYKTSSPLLGKLARDAARSGYPTTALKLLRQILGELPTSVYAYYKARMTVEIMIRLANSALRGRRGETFDLPDWREWDAPPTRARVAA